MPSRTLAARPADRSAMRFAPAVAVLTLIVTACSPASAPAAPTASPAPAMASSPTPAVEPSAAVSPDASDSRVDPDAGAALDAFRAFIQADQTFRMQSDMQIQVGDRTIDMDVAADVAAPDERAEIIIRSGAASVAMELILLDGVAYAQLANRPWQVLPTEFTSANPLSGLDVEGLEPMGAVNVRGTRTHHFRVADPSLVDPTLLSATSITEVEIDELSFDVYITDEGEPLAALMELSGSGVAEGTRQSIDARIRYDFSRFGEFVTIRKPAVVPSPATP